MYWSSDLCPGLNPLWQPGTLIYSSTFGLKIEYRQRLIISLGFRIFLNTKRKRELSSPRYSLLFYLHVWILSPSGEDHFRTPSSQNSHSVALKAARDSGIKVTVHAGELGPAEHVTLAIEDYFAERIGHGYALHDECVERTLHAEVRDGRVRKTDAQVDSPMIFFWVYNIKKLLK